jgi:2,5-diketo-D-gluconate reductase A
MRAGRPAMDNLHTGLRPTGTSQTNPQPAASSSRTAARLHHIELALTCPSVSPPAAAATASLLASQEVFGAQTNFVKKTSHDRLATARMRDGELIPLVGLGTYLSDSGEETETSCLAALSAGYRHIDTAQGYDNEESVGMAIAKSGVARDEVFVTTKLWPGNAEWGEPEPDFDGVLAACAASLHRLGLQYVDLYLIHAPFSRAHRLDQWRACLELRRRGLCRSVGVSNYAERHLQEIESAGLELPVVNQLELHPLNTKPELLEFMAQRNILPVAYSSLAPLSTWRQAKGHVEASAKSAGLVHATSSPFASIAARYEDSNGGGVDEARLLLRWAVQQGWPVLPKSSRQERVLSNMDLFSFEISDDDMVEMTAMNQNLAMAWGAGDPCDTL